MSLKIAQKEDSKIEDHNNIVGKIVCFFEILASNDVGSPNKSRRMKNCQHHALRGE